MQGLVLCYVAYSMMTGLLYTLVDWLPIVRNLVSIGVSIMNGGLAAIPLLLAELAEQVYSLSAPRFWWQPPAGSFTGR